MNNIDNESDPRYRMMDYLLKILIVDDDPNILDSFKRFFKKKAIIETADSGQKAIDILSKGGEYAVVVSDYKMPGMNGIEFFTKVKEIAPQSVRIMLSGHHDIKIAVQAVNRGSIFRFLTKPTQEGELSDAISSALDQYILVKEKEEAESKLRESERKLIELNATKDKFFSIIAHDLISPFQTLVNLSQIMKDAYETLDEVKLKKYIHLMSDASKNTLNLIENLLSWSRSQTGKLVCRPITLNIGFVINAALHIIDEKAKKKRLDVRIDVPEVLTVYADPNMVSGILRNLLYNAVKFTSTGGNITISAKENEEYVEVSVMDDGIGISPEDQRKLFKVEESFTKKGTHSETGTGLGLILCKEFVEKSGGNIFVESTLGKGSRFAFTLPKDIIP